MNQDKTRSVEIRLLCQRTGMSLRDAAAAITQFGTAEKAMAELPTPEARFGFADDYKRDREHARLYRALRDSLQFVPMESGECWTLRRVGAPSSSAQDLDAAARKMLEPRKS